MKINLLRWMNMKTTLKWRNKILKILEFSGKIILWVVQDIFSWIIIVGFLIEMQFLIITINKNPVMQEIKLHLRQILM